MLRNLYRFYLYAICIALLIFVAVTFGMLLSTLFSFTSLRGEFGTVPSQAQVTQSIVFVIVALVIGGGLAGLHYWLIRRDIRSDPEAGNSGIRSFFLNVPEAIAVSLIVPMFGYGFISSLAFMSNQDLAGTLASVLATSMVVVVLELERRRITVSSGTALFFQRLHFYGVQVVLLLMMASNWTNELHYIINSISGNAIFRRFCVEINNPICIPYNPFLVVLTLLWFVAAWIGYGWLSRNDNGTVTRFLLQGVQLAFGASLIIYGLYVIIEILLLPLFNVTFTVLEVFGPTAVYDFVSPLTLGLLVVGVMHFWLRRATRLGSIDSRVLFFTEWAIVAGLAAAAFWWGVGNLLYNVFQTLNPIPYAPDGRTWASAVAFTIVGAGYIPLDFYLRQRTKRDPEHAATPRRGFVFVLLGAGILSLAIGGATALYAWITALFGSPFRNWQQIAHIGLSDAIVGALLVGIYLWSFWNERLLVISPAPVAQPVLPPSPVPETVVVASQMQTVEEVVDTLLDGKISRDDAVKRLHELLVSQSS